MKLEDTWKGHDVTALRPPQPPGPVPPSSGIPSLLRRELHRYGLAPSSPALRCRVPFLIHEPRSSYASLQPQSLLRERGVMGDEAWKML